MHYKKMRMEQVVAPDGWTWQEQAHSYPPAHLVRQHQQLLATSLAQVLNNLNVPFPTCF
jgi:hypothetical protein